MIVGAQDRFLFALNFDQSKQRANQAAFRLEIENDKSSTLILS